MDQSIIEAIAQLGFPVVVATFLIWYMVSRQEKKIDHLAAQINENTKTVAFLAVTLAKVNGLDPDELRRYVSWSGNNAQN